MLTNIFKLRLKMTVFAAYFLLDLSFNAVFADDVDKKDPIKENLVISAVTGNAEDTECAKNMKNAKSSVDNESACVVLDIKNAKNTNNIKKAQDIENAAATMHEEVNSSKINFPKESANCAGSLENKTIETKEIKEMKKKSLTKEGKRSAIDAAPFPKLATKTAGTIDGVTEKPFADNEQIKVVLSNRDINRVLVTGDKIQSINGPAGLYTAKNDAVGSAYISLYGNTVFTVFASTVKGHNFSILVTPRAVAGRTVILQPTTPSLLTARFEETESYQKVLVALISSMINNEVLEDYAYSEAKRSEKVGFYGIADIKPIVFYGGSHLVGIISELKNKSKTSITLKPSYFYKPGVRAVALSCQTIAPSETGLLYQVVGK
jgi:type-F conjugative transfer system secretin TraK